jgi:hypothetical protein
MDDAGLEREFGERLIPEGFTKKGSRILHGETAKDASLSVDSRRL